MTDSLQSHSVSSRNGLPQNSMAAITEADVLITGVLADRPARQPDLAAENQALHTLAQQLMDDPQSMLKTLVQIARDLCRADTVGVSFLDLADGTSVFRWVAIAGALESLEQTTTPGNVSPCGTTIHCGQPQLYARPELYFTYLYHPQFPIVEGLQFPLCANNQQLGTIWIISHNEQRRFDCEDQRLMTSLAGFSTAALQSMHLRQTAELALQREQAARLETRKQTENALRESEAFNRSVFESSADCIMVLNLNGCLLSVNSPGLCLMEIEDGTPLVGTSWIEFWQDSDRANADNAVKTASSGGTGRFSGYCPTAKGTPKWWDVVVTPISDVLGKPKQLLVVSRDITDRKQAEAALRDSEEKFRNMADNAPVMVWVTDPTGYCHYLSQSWYDFTGQTKETGLGFGWLNVTHPDDREYACETFKAANERQEAFRLEYRVRRFDGEYIWAIDAASPWFGVHGQFEGYIGSVIDISDRKWAEEALRGSENRLRLALESAELGTWDFNPITGVLKWDDRCKAMFGLSPAAEIDYDVFLAGLHPEDRDRTHQVVLFSLSPESGGEYDIEYRTVGIEDGVERWIASKGKAFFNQAGVAIRFIGTNLNITEKKRAEAEREQLLQREQAAREEAEAANRIKDEFLAVLSHELRSPLNPILGWSRLLQSRKFDVAKTAQALATIERNAKLQSELIEDLLDVSRILQGKLSLTVSPIDLASTIRAALDTVRLAAEAKSIKVEASLDLDVSCVLGDATRLQQVVWNLLSNAIKFTPTGGWVEVRLTQVDNQAQITVRDNGKGIPSAFLPYVFDYFRQADSTTTRKFGGLGLGLAIVRHLVELHGGTVEADSPGEGLGATFTVRLPLMPICSAENQAEQFSQSSLNLQGVKVLVVDDDTDTREFLVFLLEQAEASVISATSAGEAFAALTQSKPDIFLSDIGMPDMDGYMLMRQVRALPPEQGGQIPAIALTAYAGDFNEKQALAAGFQRHVAKPVEPNELVKAIVTLLRRS